MLLLFAHVKLDLVLGKVKKARRSGGLRVPNTIPDLFSELANVLGPVAASSTLASGPGASVLSSQNELLRTKLLKTWQILHARESKLSGELQKDIARPAGFERSL